MPIVDELFIRLPIKNCVLLALIIILQAAYKNGSWSLTHNCNENFERKKQMWNKKLQSTECDIWNEKNCRLIRLWSVQSLKQWTFDYKSVREVLVFFKWIDSEVVYTGSPKCVKLIIIKQKTGVFLSNSFEYDFFRICLFPPVTFNRMKLLCKHYWLQSKWWTESEKKSKIWWWTQLKVCHPRRFVHTLSFSCPLKNWIKSYSVRGIWFLNKKKTLRKIWNKKNRHQMPGWTVSTKPRFLKIIFWCKTSNSKKRVKKCTIPYRAGFRDTTLLHKYYSLLNIINKRR